MKKRIPQAAYIFAAMLLGILVGYLIFNHYDKGEAKEWLYLDCLGPVPAPHQDGHRTAGVLDPGGGIAHMGDAKSVGRIFGKSLAWFFIASLVSLALGMIMANLLQPGAGVALPSPDAAGAGLATSKFTVKEFFNHLVPKSIVEAMAQNEILQVVVFSMFFGIALAALGERGKNLLAVIDDLSHTMLKITVYVMKFAPVAVFAAMAATVAVNGLEILVSFAVFMRDFYFSLVLLWVILIAVGFVFLKKRIFHLLALIKEAFLLAFATASSEAAYPKLLDALDRFGVKRKISSFVMPMGYSFNLDGSMIYCTFATLFIAQAYGIHMPISTQITMMLVLMLTSKGIAGVPRASLVVIAATLHQFNIPEAGLLVILGIDTFLDMGRSATNAVGNSIASAVVAKWEGGLLSEEEAARAESRSNRSRSHTTHA
jgi:Na+/H+-dicarboxylate symporter